MPPGHSYKAFGVSERLSMIDVINSLAVEYIIECWINVGWSIQEGLGFMYHTLHSILNPESHTVNR